MLLKVDAKALEWRVKVYLSQDKVALEEILNGIDIHAESQRLFMLPAGPHGRLIAKKMNFRMIFADAYSDQGFSRPAFAYANDWEYSHVSTSIKYWEKIVEGFFNKYKGMHQHGQSLISQVYEKGFIVNPTGRVYEFYHTVDKNGDPELPRTLILNYPVQGLAADIMALARVVLRRRLMDSGYNLDENVLLINTIHDDIELDVDNDEKLIYNICVIMEEVMSDLPLLFKQTFKKEFNVPLSGEVFYGHNLGNLTQFNRKEKITI